MNIRQNVVVKKDGDTKMDIEDSLEIVPPFKLRNMSDEEYAEMVKEIESWTPEKRAERGKLNYIKITNEADSVPRLFLELLGVSTKRDNDNLIGQFGSGTKFAPIHALRKGWEWISTGYDSLGGYTMSYCVDDDNEDGIEVVQFVYEDLDGNITKKDSSYSMGAGELGWSHPFQIFREAFANALDAHYENGSEYSLDITNRVFEPVEGEFSVYLTADETMLDIVENFDKYFSLNREDVVFEDVNGNKAFHKLEDEEEGAVRIYHKGVLVYGPEINTGVSYYSLFDYDLRTVELNEERTLKNVSSNEIYNIAWMIGKNQEYETGCNEFAAHILKNMRYRDDCWEWRASHAWQMPSWLDEIDVKDISAFGKVFSEMAEERYCDQVHPMIAYAKWDSAGYDEVELRLKERGYRVLGVSQAMYNLLGTTGAEDKIDKNILGEEFDTEFIELGVEDKRFFDLAHSTLLSYDMNIINYPIKFMKTTDRNEHVMGKAAPGKNGEPDLILINECVIKARNIKTLLATLVHEMDHFLTQKEDNTREFRDAADDRLGDLLLKHYCDKSNLIEIMQESI